MEAFLLLASFAVILAGALLFTNAVEWAGNRLEIGEGATGSLLAAVGTAMPETLIPIVAIIGGAEGAEDVAIGAIIGAPFLLATVVMALVFNGYELGGLVFAVLIASLVTAEGESNWFEGVQLLALYAVLGLVFYFA